MSLGTTDRRYIRVVDAHVEWRCLACDIWTPFTIERCQGCGQSRAKLPAVAERDAVAPLATVGATPVDRPGRGEHVAAVMCAAIVPGAGHLVLGRTMAGLTRLLIAGVWLGAGLHWALGAADVRIAGQVLLTGVAVLWGTSLVDVVALTRRQAEPVGARGLLWLVVVVTSVLIVVIVLLMAGAQSL